MDARPIVFVAFEEQDNLGVGYLASVLTDAGFTVRIVDFRIGEAAILDHLRRLDPLLVGFSVIFQHHIERFRSLLESLRAGGIACPFIAGGHYPSLRYETLLSLIPEFDAVVLFEGEHTCLELARALAEGQDWRALPGLAYRRDDGTVAATPLRPLEPDLDCFPVPVRLPLREYAFGKKFATLLAGRGCLYDCVFCSIREFYARPPGSVKRVRRPERVVREMQLLHERLGCTIFMFQDDDFPITYQRGAWLDAYLRGLDDAGLTGKVLWKINCRPDEVTPETFARMSTRGLFLVYLGIESGTDEGLRGMQKHITAATNLDAAATLNALGIAFDYGFMFFDPASTFARVAADLDFLDALVGDGASPVTFCKMLPYAGTQVEAQLLAAGRLRGAPGHEDYAFLDPNLDRLYALMANSFVDWIGEHDGLLNLARWARHYLAVYRRSYGATPEHARLVEATRAVIAESNLSFTGLTRQMLELCQHNGKDGARAAALASEAGARHEQYRAALSKVMAEIEALPC